MGPNSQVLSLGKFLVKSKIVCQNVIETNESTIKIWVYWSLRSFQVEIWIVLDSIDDQKWKLWYTVSFSNRHLAISRAQTQRNYIVLCKAMIGAHQFCKLPFPHGINAIYESFYWADQNSHNLYENNGNLISLAGGRHFVDIIGVISWTKGVTSRGHLKKHSPWKICQKK